MTIDIRKVAAENRLSPKIVLVALLVLQTVLSLAADYLPYGGPTVGETCLGFLALAALCAVAWYLVARREQLARWLALILWTFGLAFTALTLGTPSALSWMALVPVIAVLLISFPAALAVAVVSSGIVIGIGIALGATSVATGVSLLAVWGIPGAFYALLHPLYGRIAWLEQHFELARVQLDEVRDGRAAYEQTLEDLTHANRQMVLMTQRVAGLRQVAEEAQKAKTRFVARVSHEFRTPLNMIIGLVELMVTSPEIYDVTLSPRMREALQVVYRNCEHLSDMVDDVLDLTRIEMDRMALHKERVDLADIIGSAIEAVSPLLAGKCLELRTEVPPEMPLVYCDRTRVEQVVLNLLSNAARHTDEGGITVRIACGDQHVCVSVADTGSGIPSEDVDRIFEPFSQGTAELWRDRGGSGLGLSISKQFVELHGGRMWLESEFGVGTTVFFDLPTNPTLGPVARAGHQTPEDWAWRDRPSRASFAEAHYSPRFLVCDETGELESFLAFWSDRIEFITLPNLEHTLGALKESPAHAVLLNCGDLQRLWEEIMLLRPAAVATPVIGCSIVRNDGRARSLCVLGHLVKPVRRQDIAAALASVGDRVCRVLVVDDDPDALQLFGEMLRACDSSLEVIAASSGQDALLKLQQAAPDLMLLDLVMPGVDGWQVLEAMANGTGVRRVPTFLISAQDPRDQLTRSGFLLVSAEGGLSLNAVIELSLTASDLLPGPKAIPDSVLG